MVSTCKSRTVPDQLRKRDGKVQGTAKLDVGCTSQIILRKTESGELNAEYFKDHYGHTFDLKHIHHIHLSTNFRRNVASKLIMGVTPQHVLSSARQQIGPSLKRDDLITMKDIGNIKTSFNISLKDGQRHKNDMASVDLYVSECEHLGEHNPILFYKKQGEYMDRFEQNDVCLIIMNSVQKELFKKFVGNIVCVDGTHGLNSYDFEMTTILVLDEFREGFPVAFLFSNRKDQHVYEVFFKHVKNAVGMEQVNINTFMTDITNVYYTAWVSVMGSVSLHLYCSWHIDRAWQQNLGKVKSTEEKNWVYKTLKYIQTLPNEIDFETQYFSFLTKLSSKDSTQQMYNYLKTYYWDNRKQWAYCYRKNRGINTNMFLESMHKVIKYEYLDGKKVKRLDKTLHALQKFITDKTVSRLIKLTKGHTSKQLTEIKKKHKIAECREFEVSRDGNCYIFHKVKDEPRYLVQRKNNENECCELKCSSCNICWHAFECTCPDYQIKNMICKHIHFVCFKKLGHSLPISSFLSKEEPREEQSEELSMLVKNINSSS
ncbi:uncharacterized protein LOC114343556 [Diabrotica virgifera virgifera]|uniref:SWIM-type domain-containing protein n=1 Tax=Diabrotica virgifera virgifera TaxID=50390 RepID=A0ABM5KD91_DIAVI|nr:uncharacterized protein LOC114343556 [Diabrotica virgifera virgifera]